MDNARIEQAHHFNHLGSKITDDGRSKADVLNGIAQAKRAFQNKKHLLTTNRCGPLQVRKKFLKMYVRSIALQGCETWTIGTAEKKETRGLRDVVLSRNAKD